MAVTLDPETESVLEFYLGPVEPAALKAAAPELPRMMYAGLWFWLRWICSGLFVLLGWIHAVVPNWALAIVLLSLSVSILMRPLSRIADRLQDDVHRSEALLAPELREIRANHKGEEQSKRVLELYKKHNVHPLYSLKSLAGVAVVIPVFIGAFDMLAENIWLANESALWIEDLARPDAFATLLQGMAAEPGRAFVYLQIIPTSGTGAYAMAPSLESETIDELDAAIREAHLRTAEGEVVERVLLDLPSSEAPKAVMAFPLRSSSGEIWGSLSGVLDLAPLEAQLSAPTYAGLLVSLIDGRTLSELTSMCEVSTADVEMLYDWYAGTGNVATLIGLRSPASR